MAADFLLLIVPKIKDTVSGPHSASAIKISKDAKYKSKSVGKTGMQLCYCTRMNIRSCLRIKRKNSWTNAQIRSPIDFPVVGENVYILENAGRKVSISVFIDASLLVDVIHAAVVYDCHTLGNPYLVILLMHNWLRLFSLVS